MNKFDSFYESVLFSLAKEEVIFENFDAESIDNDPLSKYKKLMESRNMTFHLNGSEFNIIFFDHFDRDIRQTADYEKRVTDKIKPYEEALLKDLRLFLQNNLLLTQATSSDLEIGSYPFTYTVDLKYHIANRQNAEEILREAIKMYDKIYRFMRKRFHALKVF